jgi:hypothetical protein
MRIPGKNTLISCKVEEIHWSGLCKEWKFPINIV